MSSKIAKRSKGRNKAKEVMTPERPSWLRNQWLWGLSLTLAVILTYVSVWHAGFIWDDDFCVTKNPCIVGPLGLKEIWTTKAADIAPLTFTTFWVVHALWGLNPLPYHLVNVLLQAGAAILLWRVLRALQVPGAWLGAALWALHPVTVESVAWMTEMKNTQSGLFFLLSVLFFVKWRRAKERSGPTRGGWSYGLTLILAAAAMASKSSTVILPVVLCLAAWWIEGRWRWRNFILTAPVFIMSAAGSALAIWTEGFYLAVVADPQWVRTWPQRIAGAGKAFWFYLGKLAWPSPLMTIYPRWQIEAGQIFSYLPLAAALGLLTLLWLKREVWPRAWFFAFAYFLVALLPVLGLINNPIFQYSLVFDHFQYLASMGPLALAGAGLARLSGLFMPKQAGAQAIGGVGLLLILGMVSGKRTWVYGNQETLWTAELAENPNCWLGHNDLGVALAQKGRIDDALAQFQQCLDINPNYAEAHNNLGAMLVKKGRLEEAMAQFQTAVDIDPEHNADANYNLGLVLLQKGRLPEAMVQFKRCLEVNPRYAQAYFSIGVVAFQNGLWDEAMAKFRKALEVDPNDANAYYNLGVTLFQKGRLEEAMAEYQRALAINPSYAEAHNNLGFVLFRQGRLDEAIPQFQRALEINPNYTDAQNNLENARAEKAQ